MKDILLFFSLLFLIGCGSDKVKNPAPSANPDAHAGHDHATDNPNIVTNPDGTVHVKGDVTAFLVGIWEVEYALIGSSSKVDPGYKGAWIKMNPDFTFTTGVYDQQTNKGTYKFQAEPTRMLTFTYDKEEKLLPTEAEVMGYSIELVLLGVTPMEGRKSQLKIGRVNNKPSRPN